jgi:hypothetical protein
MLGSGRVSVWWLWIGICYWIFGEKISTDPAIEQMDPPINVQLSSERAARGEEKRGDEQRTTGNGKGARWKQRGKRQKLVALASFNSSGKPQLLQALGSFASSKVEAGEQGEVQVAGVMVQEHHARGPRFADLQRQSEAKGWTVFGAQAAAGDRAEGLAGVAVATLSPLSQGRAGKDRPIDQSTAASPGRLCASWTDGILRGGLLIVSLYLHDSEGWTDRNLDLFSKAADLILKHGGPWVLGGDFNMPPEKLNSVDHILRRMRGVIVAPRGTTCSSAPGGNTID